MKKGKVLIAGVSGLVGNGAARHFVKSGWDVVGVSRHLLAPIDGVEFVSVDLLDPKKCEEVFSKMSDITHVVFAAVNEKPNLIETWVDHEGIMNNFKMLKNLFDPLEKAAKNLKHITLLQGTKAYGLHLGLTATPAKESSPRLPHENFYWYQEDYIQEKMKGKKWTWNALRPPIILGPSVGSNLSTLQAIATYAAMQKEAGEKILPFIGGATNFTDCVDLDLLSKALEWAVTAPAAQNQHFNIANGDVIIWTELWKTIADEFGMKAGDNKPYCLSKEMPKRNKEWAAMVKKYGLKVPADLGEFLGISFEVADLVLGYGFKQVNPIFTSTIRARKAGFNDCIDTDECIRKCIKQMRERKIIPA